MQFTTSSPVSGSAKSVCETVTIFARGISVSRARALRMTKNQAEYTSHSYKIEIISTDPVLVEVEATKISKVHVITRLFNIMSEYVIYDPTYIKFEHQYNTTYTRVN